MEYEFELHNYIITDVSALIFNIQVEEVFSLDHIMGVHYCRYTFFRMEAILDFYVNLKYDNEVFFHTCKFGSNKGGTSSTKF